MHQIALDASSCSRENISSYSPPLSVAASVAASAVAASPLGKAYRVTILK